jgi:hypothetical protein
MKRYQRCQRCKKKNTLVDISSEIQKINPFTYRSYVGIQCSVCNWNDKTYTFTDVEEGKS